MIAAARYVWAHPYGHVAVMALVVGIIGLTLHNWAGFLVLPALQSSSYRARHRRATYGNHRMTRGKARR